MKITDIHYYAGFFDGEGSASLINAKDRHGKVRTRLTATITQIDREVLDYLVAEMGCGNVHACSSKKALARGQRQCYQAVFTHRSAREFLVLIEPYLRVKKDHVTGLLDITGRSIEKASTTRIMTH
jgi:hypothetical protein